MEAPVESDTDDSKDESISFNADEVDFEVDINIHFHCEHCFKLNKCREPAKPGWSCEVVWCPNDCGQRFHTCKMDEHQEMCSEERVHCINAIYGCPQWMPRRCLSDHLPYCPASVVVCNAEWNRWALGAREREKVAITKGLTALYDSKDLDMALALHDQDLVNEMHKLPRRVRATFCNGITRRFPCLPITIKGSRHASNQSTPQKSTDEEEELTPEPKKQNRNDDVSVMCCVHGILKNICMFCRDDPEDPHYKMGKVWRERVSCKKPGEIKWTAESCIEKVRKRNPFGVYCYKKYESDEEEEDEEENLKSLDKMNLIVDEHGKPVGTRERFQTPPPAPLTSKGLTMELGIKHYSRHQTKPRAMFTFQCLQEVRRSEFSSHYQNVHSEIQEGLEGWLLHRCPLHLIGCPYSSVMLHPGRKEGNVIYCDSLKAFGVRPKLDYDPAPCGGLPRSRSPSVEKTSSSFSQMNLTPSKRTLKTIPESHGNNHLEVEHYYASSLHLTYLPVEILLRIASFLDGFSLNNLSLSCRLMRDVCFSLLNERGLIVLEWIRYIEDGQVRWRQGKKRRFFSRSFEPVDQWGFKSTSHMANHLKVCPFNVRHIAENKFTYGHFKRPRKAAT
ncbi:F-box only protein 30-like isoform X2 [Palaemon carinicauda]|uniref:F-box only protein 30-like isoform X2 n=1 Tax=Palaemon carinicauda TaxID=392227 RepID=UPI0035B65407